MAFDGFVSHTPLADRGGHIRAHKTPHATRTGSSPPGYHVESSFTELQHAYLGLCVAALTKLAQGEVIGGVGPEQPSLNVQIQSRFLGETALQLLFAKSVVSSTATLFESFGSLYPNLTPALDAMCKTGAAVEGAALAVLASQELLGQALDKRESHITYLAPQATRGSFTGVHPLFSEQKSYEIWCPGEALGKTIMREVGMAASVLAETPGVQEAYDLYNDVFTVGVPEIRRQIEEGMQRAISSARSS